MSVYRHEYLRMKGGWGARLRGRRENHLRPVSLLISITIVDIILLLLLVCSITITSTCTITVTFTFTITITMHNNNDNDNNNDIIIITTTTGALFTLARPLARFFVKRGAVPRNKGAPEKLSPWKILDKLSMEKLATSRMPNAISSPSR